MITDWIMVAITFVYVVATVFICYFNYQSAKATRKQLEEMKKQYKEENRPNIQVEFIFERQMWYIIRFINHGKLTAQDVNIQLTQEFIDSLPQAEFRSTLNRQKDKKCIIGVGQHYDLFIGSRILRENPNMIPVKGVVTYQSNGMKYSSDIYIDLENYMTIFKSSNDHDDLMKAMENVTKELKNIAGKLKK